MIEPWPLTGRTDELRLVDGLGVRTDRTAGMVLAGAAGVGKTRLAREVVDRVGRRGVVTRWIAATDSSRGLPLGAFAPIVGDVGADPSRLLPRATAAVLDVPRPRGMLIAVDDAHLLDDVSAALVQQLTLQRQAQMLLTVRSGETAPAAVVALWKDRHLQRLELRPLSRDDTQALLEAVLGGPVETPSAGRFWSITRGNALYLRQLLDGELTAGRLVRRDGVWKWTGEPELSPSLVELIRTRMGALSDELRAVLEYLAFGEPLGAPLLADLTDRDSVEEAERRGLIEVRPDRRRLQARLAHPLYGEVVRAECGRLRSRSIRGRLATTIAATGARRTDDTLRRALLCLESDLKPDPDLFTSAAQRAVLLYDSVLGERLARAAIAAGGGFEPAMTLATALVGAAAQPAEAAVAALSDFATTDSERARAAVLQATSMIWMAGNVEVGITALDAAYAAVTEESSRLTLTALYANVDATMGRPAAALDGAEAVLAAPQRSTQADALGCFATVMAWTALGRTEDFAALVDRSVEVSEHAVDVNWIPVPTMHWTGYALRLTGDVTGARAMIARARQRFADQEGPALTLEVSQGALDLAAGRVATAAQLLGKARADLTSWGIAGGWTFACLIEQTRALALAGNRAAARRALADLEAELHPAFPLLHPDATVSRAWVLACEGAVGQAIELAHEAARVCRERGAHAFELAALYSATRFGDGSGAARLQELAGLVDGPRAAVTAAHAAALAADDPVALGEVSVRFEESGDLLAAADAAAHSAVRYVRRGRQGSAQAATARANRLAELCEGARTPALAAVVSPLPLSDREREILVLAVDGLSNKEIANRLVVSVRTVEGHRYRACTKLGTSDLAQLAALLRGE